MPRTNNSGSLLLILGLKVWGARLVAGIPRQRGMCREGCSVGLDSFNEGFLLPAENMH